MCAWRLTDSVFSRPPLLLTHSLVYIRSGGAVPGWQPAPRAAPRDWAAEGAGAPTAGRQPAAQPARQHRPAALASRPVAARQPAAAPASRTGQPVLPHTAIPERQLPGGAAVQPVQPGGPPGAVCGGQSPGRAAGGHWRADRPYKAAPARQPAAVRCWAGRGAACDAMEPCSLVLLPLCSGLKPVQISSLHMLLWWWVYSQLHGF